MKVIYTSSLYYLYFYIRVVLSLEMMRATTIFLVVEGQIHVSNIYTGVVPSTFEVVIVYIQIRQV